MGRRFRKVLLTGQYFMQHKLRTGFNKRYFDLFFRIQFLFVRQT